GRVAVEERAFEGVPVAPERCQPLLGAAYLALAERWRAARPAGEAAVARLDAGRDQVLDAERAGDRRGDELVGRGDDRAQVAVRAMRVDQRARRGPDRRADHLVHELPVPGVELASRMRGQRRELEREELVDVERARVVLVEEQVVAALVL